MRDHLARISASVPLYQWHRRRMLLASAGFKGKISDDALTDAGSSGGIPELDIFRQW
jgi:hypothetical protein